MEKGVSPSLAPSHILTPSEDSTFHSGFQKLIQHNATSAPFHLSNKRTVDTGANMGSNPHSRYTSPVPQSSMIPPYEHHTPVNQASPYVASSYTGSYQTTYSVDQSPYPQLPDMAHSATPHNAYSTPATSPPTPVQNEGVITTRSGRAIPRPQLSTLTRPARVEKPSPKPRPARRKKKVTDVSNGKLANLLGQPLSQLVRDLTNVADTDIEAYVNRSPEERQREVGQSKNGKVKRPMNAFMLYRKAYQNRTKEWKRLDDIRRREERASEGKPEKGHDNHQVISQVCGLSWNMEPQELRDQYDEWAKIERNNHKIAFPDYKFAPAKSKLKKPGGGGGGSGGGGGGDSRRDQDSDDDDATSILEAYDAQDLGHPHSGPPSRNTMRSSRYHDPDGEYMLPTGYHSVYGSPSPNLQHARLPASYAAQAQARHPHPSSFQYTNPGKPRPGDYGSALGQGQYYQQTTEYAQQVYPHHYGGAAPHGLHHSSGMPAYIENIYVNKANSPGASYHGLPHMGHHTYDELMGPSASYTPHLSHSHNAMQSRHAHHSHQQHSSHTAHHMLHHAAEHHQIDPSLMATHHQEPGGAGLAPAEATYDSLGILHLGHGNEFSGDALSTYQLEHGGVGLGGSHAESPPQQQQFEQAYHTPNDTTATSAGEVGVVGEGAPHGPVAPAESSSWQDDEPGGTGTDVKIGASDWVTTLGGGVDFQLEDIDQILGTTTDSPGG
ncbi:hypothetical protein F5Y17DRAFT_4495 [Xylariaceae sp. FL0594]|nr:hypothetical protein F5Y17DRAFT_4495 [Xylariaceae sp. FL0594]